MRHRSTAWSLAALVIALGFGGVAGIAQAATVLHHDFNETGNAAGSSGTNATPVRMRNDAGTALDFHSADAGGVSGLPGDRSFANTGPSAQGSLASAATNGFRADQPDLAAVDGLGAFTISGWFKTELANVSQIQNATPRLVNNASGSGATATGFNLQFLSTSEGDLKLDVDDDTGTAVSAGARYSGKQKWVFFAVSYDGAAATNNVNFYIGFRNDAEAGGGPGSANVSLVTTATLNRGSVADDTGGLTLANRPAGDRPFKGFLDEIRVDNVAHAGSGGLAALEAYRQAALVAPRDMELRHIGTVPSMSVAALDQNSSPVTVPELSGLTYDPTAGRFWAIGDGNQKLLQINVSFDANGGIVSAVPVSAVSLVNASGVDFEGIAFTNAVRNSVFVSEEDSPGVREYSLATGALLQTLNNVPSVFTLPGNLRSNRGFESLARSPDALEMLTGVEQALTVDGPAGVSPVIPTVSRLLRYALTGDVTTPAEQFAYVVEPQHVSGTGDGSSLSELIILPNGELLAMERSVVGTETLIRIFLASRAGATDVSQGPLSSGLIGQSYTPLTKTLLYSDFSLGKFEGLAVGPTLASGKRALLGVEDAGGTTAVIRSFVLSGDFAPDPCGNPVVDTDSDTICDAIDPDDDNDLVEDALDAAPLDRFLCRDADADTCDDCTSGTSAPTSDGLDTDTDGQCDAGDSDDDGDAVADAEDAAPLDRLICRDTDADTCDDCTSGTSAPTSDGLDTDTDGQCDAGDSDDDGDAVADAEDAAPLDRLLCRDTDADTCDDCTSGTSAPINDGLDTDADGQCDTGDSDDDGDAVADAEDAAPLDRLICRDTDADTCDDCTSGTSAPTSDGLDTDTDGQCDAGDSDDDGDAVADAEDAAPLDRLLCRDTDADTCDDCTSGTSAPTSDGLDTDTDGQCDAGDSDDDGDGVADGSDLAPLNRFACRDADADTCDDCTSGTSAPTSDGLDTDTDGQCDAGDSDDDGDAVADAEDAAPLDRLICRDADADTCDDCTSGTSAPTSDGLDTDTDGQCDAGDSDDDGDGVADGSDLAPLNRFACRDADADTCDDCTSGTSAPTSDGLDTDTDGQCDAGDSDDDGDAVADAEDAAPLDRLLCRDTDADTCDDCTSGTSAPTSDGLDTDTDGQCDAGDSDDDGDAVADAEDAAPLDRLLCRDTDADTCDDCTSGTSAPTSDGLDTDTDGLCDAGDSDDDGDAVADAEDAAPLDRLICRDTDADTCDDCTSGTSAPTSDGLDTDADGQCNAGDPDDDGDTILDAQDNCPFFPSTDTADTDADGRGDECECTDQNGDGRNNVSDLVAINRAIFSPALITPLCDGNNDGLCDVNDIIAANIEIFSPTNTSTCSRQPVPGP